MRFPRPQTVEINLALPEISRSETVNIDGAVRIPGVYALKSSDTIDSLLQAAGGLLDTADVTRIKIFIPEVHDNPGEQKIDLNRAGSWLLEALPGIGKTLSGRIIDYRCRNGPFRNINELTQVKGITSGVLENIKDYITVSE